MGSRCELYIVLVPPTLTVSFWYITLQSQSTWFIGSKEELLSGNMVQKLHAFFARRLKKGQDELSLTVELFMSQLLLGHDIIREVRALVAE